MTTRLLMVCTVDSSLRAFLLPFARHFRSLGWRVDAMANGVSRSPECVADFDNVWDINWTRNPLSYQNLSTALKRIQRVVRNEEYDVVHVHTPVASFVTRFALRRMRQSGKPRVIYTAHGFHFYRGGPWLRNAAFAGLERLAGRWTDDLIVINREDAESAAEMNIVPPEHLHYMPGIGVDLDYYRPDRVSEADVAAVRAELGLTPSTPLLLTVAEFIPRKRHSDCLHAFARLPRTDAHYAFAGDGRLFESTQRLAAELGIADRVHFLGKRRDIPQLTRAANACILVSDQEGLPRTVMESLSLETPMIATGIRGTKELLADGCGITVNVGDVQGLTDAMQWILDHPEQSRELGRAGRVRMADYDLQRIIGLHEDLYSSPGVPQPAAMASPAV